MSATTIVRPEFQLIVAGLDFKSITGVEVKVGTTYGRLYFPEGCEMTGTFKGTILKDSWATGAAYSATRKCRVIEFICSDVSQYRLLYNLCGRSNLMGNRIRTHKLLEACFAAPAAVRVEVPPVVKSELEHTLEKLAYIAANESFDCNAYQAAEWEVRRLAKLAAPVVYATLDWVESVDEIETELIDIVAIAKSRMPVVDNALSTESLVELPEIFASDWETEDLYKCTVKQLKVIAEKLNIKVYGTKAQIITKIKASH